MMHSVCMCGSANCKKYYLRTFARILEYAILTKLYQIGSEISEKTQDARHVAKLSNLISEWMLQRSTSTIFGSDH